MEKGGRVGTLVSSSLVDIQGVAAQLASLVPFKRSTSANHYDDFVGIAIERNAENNGSSGGSNAGRLLDRGRDADLNAAARPMASDPSSKDAIKDAIGSGPRFLRAANGAVQKLSEFSRITERGLNALRASGGPAIVAPAGGAFR